MIKEPLDVVKQTGTTIVFEEFNRDRDDLVTLLTRDVEEITLEKFTLSLMGNGSGLKVESFEEFVEKFAPTVYETVVKTETGGQFVYTFEKPDDECTKIQLKDHAFYKMIMNLLNRKAATDKGLADFPYDDLKKALTPESEKEECLRIRKNLETNEKEYYKLLESGKPSSELERYAQNIVACREKIISKYKNQSPLALLPVAIADTQKKIDMMETAASNETGGSPKAIAYSYSFDDRGNLMLEEKESNLKLIENTVTNETEDTALVRCLKEDFDENALPSLTKNNFVKDLVINTFIAEGVSTLDSKERAELEEQKKVYLSVYNSSLQSFAKAVSAVVEKFAGMKTFFDHAAFNGTLAKDVSVIIANCKIDAVLNDETAKKRFLRYFRGLSEEKDVNKIWFGIIPALANETEEKVKSGTKIDPFGSLSQKNQGKNKVKKRGSLTNLETLKDWFKSLDEAKIKIMFFTNYKATEETGFMELNAKKIESWEKDFESVNNEYGVFCYPNFTILPKEASAVKTGTIVEQDMERETYIEIPGIYLDASYVAAGMMVGIQNYKLLKARGFKVKQTYPCVRFDIEEGDNNKIVTTKMNRETKTEMEKDVKAAMTEKRFGFAFADNKIEDVNNAYVVNARTLKKGNRYYKSIYKTLVKNLVDQLIRYKGDTITKEKVEEFISDYVGTWKDDNRDEDKKYANRIMHEGESISIGEGNKLIVTFNKEQEIWDDIVIDENSEGQTSEGGKK